MGTTHCRKCGAVVQKDTVDQIADRVLQWPVDTRFYVLYALTANQTEEQLAVTLVDLKRRGFSRIFQNGRTFEYTQPESLDVDFSQPAYVLVDRLKIAPDMRQRLIDSIEVCFRESNGEVILEIAGDPQHPPIRFRFNENFECRRADHATKNPNRSCFLSIILSEPALAARDSAIRLTSISTW